MQTKKRFIHRVWPAFLVLVLLIGACKPETTATPAEELASPTAETTGKGEEPASPTETTAPEPGAPTLEPTPTFAGDLPEVDSSDLPVFASYHPRAVQPAVPFEQPEIASDLSNVYNPFVLSSDQLKRLGEDGLVVSPSDVKEFYTIYERARYDNQPIFVTSDSLLHVYHLLFDKVLRTAERKYFIDLLKGLNAAMLAETDAQYQALQGTDLEEAALRSVAFTGVASKLLDPTVEVPAYAADLVEAELALIEAASGIQPSPIFPGLENGEDYTQYIPRGHYTLGEDLKAYFKSMMWYGRMTFRLKSLDPEVGKLETQTALLIVQALRNASVNGQPALDVWKDLYSPTAFFVGRSDDLTAIQYADVIDGVYGANPSLDALQDPEKLELFIETANRLPPPRILGIVIADWQPEEESTKGLRFMGQRFVPDAFIFRQLMYRNVGTRDDPRGLPKGLDIPAAMGSERAYQLLDEMGETHYANYDTQMQKMRDWVSGLSTEEWTETLYNTWLYTFFPLIAVPDENTPAFMQSLAWLDKSLNTVLGSWTELKHDTILYAKQAYAELGGGPPPPPPLPPLSYVEPVPEFYARLAELSAMTRSGLEERGMLDEMDADNLLRLENLAVSLQTMAEKELRGEPLTSEEQELIRYIGGDLEHLTMAAADSDSEDPFAQKYMDEDPQAALVADVATNPGASPEPAVLEEAVGRVFPIYVVVPVVKEDGEVMLSVTKGAVFSQYEFEWPASDRLTDEKWQQMLEEGNQPPLAEWNASFLTLEGEYADLSSAIFQFQQGVTYLYWDTNYAVSNGLVGAFEVFRPEIEALNAAKQYAAHQLVSSNVRSADLQSENLAVLTVREQWQDKLYSYEGEYPNYDEPVLGERGPYSLDATYTVEFKDGYWQVTQVVYANQAPEWE
jgi:hypothetical protein